MSPSGLVFAETWDPIGYAIFSTYCPARSYTCVPEYHWIEFWRAVLGLLEFLTKRLEELQSAAGIRLLIKEVSMVRNGLFHI